jgi:predicted lipid carrier protein YhbT
MITLMQLTPITVQKQLWHMALRPALQAPPSKRRHDIPKSGVFKVKVGGLCFSFAERQTARRVKAVCNAVLAREGAILTGDLQRLILLAQVGKGLRTNRIIEGWKGVQ